MIQTVIDVKYKAVSVGVFFFATAMSQTFATLVMGALIGPLNLEAPENIELLGIVLTLNTALPCLFASICFYMSGPHYERMKQGIEEEKSEAIDVATQNDISVL